MGRYEGKKAVVTGGTTGIGLATAKYLVAEGARVVVTGRNPGALEAARRELGTRAEVVASDTSKLEDVSALAARVEESFGTIDFLFVNAGIARFVPFEDVDESVFREILDINTKGAFFTAQKLVPLVPPGGAIVFNTSVVDELGLPSTSVYAASKAALRSFARTLATELLPKKIRVNAVSPGPITTPIFDKAGFGPDALESFRESNPMKRFGAPEEVARAAAFLAFDATYTTGAELPVDGGLSQL